MRSGFAAALQLAGIVESLGRGRALHDAAWGPLLRALVGNPRLYGGLAGFTNWCVAQGIAPHEVNDAAVQRFHTWMQERTLHPRPRGIVRGVPQLWNEARAKVAFWPQSTLSRVSFRPPRQRLAWEALSASFRCEAESYLAMRAQPDLFDERPDAPRRPLAASTLRQQKEHLRLAASTLVEAGVVDVADITCFAVLVQPERFKAILRHYHARANGQPNAFAICLAKTLLQVARYHVQVPPEQLEALKRLAAKLPSVPFELTAKNKARALESEHVRAKLLFLPELLFGEVAKAVESGAALPFVKAQMGVAIDIQLCVPLRPQNLICLDWRRHFLEPDGPRGRLLLHIPAAETKTKQRDVTIEIPDDVARRLRWYRRQILPRLNTDPDGPLFVTGKGRPKGQECLSDQMIEVIAERVGIHMTPHQFRHFAAVSYLEAHPEDFATVQALLGHSWAKTTLIYAGSSSRRASRAYGQHLLAQREQLKLKRKRATKRKRTPRRDSHGADLHGS